MTAFGHADIKGTLDQQSKRLKNTSLSSSRRAFVATLAGLPLTVLAAQLNGASPAADWIVGTWQSDAERTMRSFAFQGSHPTGEAHEKISALVGSMIHIFTRERFAVADTRTGRTSVNTVYRITGATSSTVSIAFSERTDLVNMTLYREGDSYFIRSANNFEFFRRMTA